MISIVRFPVHYLLITQVLTAPVSSNDSGENAPGDVVGAGVCAAPRFIVWFVTKTV